MSGDGPHTVRPLNCLRAQLPQAQQPHTRMVITVLPLLVAVVSVGRAPLVAPLVGDRFRLSTLPYRPCQCEPALMRRLPVPRPWQPLSLKEGCRYRKYLLKILRHQVVHPLFIWTVVTLKAVTVGHRPRVLGVCLRENPRPNPYRQMRNILTHPRHTRNSFVGKPILDYCVRVN
jgi:hypothetical protein